MFVFLSVESNTYGKKKKPFSRIKYLMNMYVHLTYIYSRIKYLMNMYVHLTYIYSRIKYLMNMYVHLTYIYAVHFAYCGVNMYTKTRSGNSLLILLAVKSCFYKYCGTIYSSSGVNQMWILKQSKDILEFITSKSL